MSSNNDLAILNCFKMVTSTYAKMTVSAYASRALVRGVNLRRHPSLGKRVAMILEQDASIRTIK